MSDEDTKRRILARRARFIAAGLAGAAIVVTPSAARAGDASVEDAGDAGDAGDGAADGADAAPVFVEAGARPTPGERDGAPPTPCLSLAKPPDDRDDGCDCAVGPTSTEHSAAGATVAAAAAALMAARRRKKER